MSGYSLVDFHTWSWNTEWLLFQYSISQCSKLIFALFSIFQLWYTLSASFPNQCMFAGRDFLVCAWSTTCFSERRTRWNSFQSTKFSFMERFELPTCATLISINRFKRNSFVYNDNFHIWFNDANILLTEFANIKQRDHQIHQWRINNKDG